METIWRVLAFVSETSGSKTIRGMNTVVCSIATLSANFDRTRPGPQGETKLVEGLGPGLQMHNLCLEISPLRSLCSPD